MECWVECLFLDLQSVLMLYSETSKEGIVAIISKILLSKLFKTDLQAKIFIDEIIHFKTIWKVRSLVGLRLVMSWSL